MQNVKNSNYITCMIFTKCAVFLHAALLFVIASKLPFLDPFGIQKKIHIYLILVIHFIRCMVIFLISVTQ